MEAVSATHGPRDAAMWVGPVVTVYDKRASMGRWLRGKGIEIGALHHPLSVPPGAAVSYVDWLSVDGLRDHYPELADEPLVPVDIIASAEDLSPLPDASQDFVIACHLFEHLENPLRGLVEAARVLRPGGILYIALPDPRVTFDRERALTTVEHVVGEYRGGVEATREAHYVDWVERAEPLVDWIQAAGLPTGPERVRDLLSTAHSIHFHVWRAEDFIEVVQAARREAGVSLELLEFRACDPRRDNEYILVFAKEAVEPSSPFLGDADGATGDAVQPEHVSALEDRLRSQSEALQACLALQASTTFRLAARCRTLVRRAAPPGTVRRRLTARLARGLSGLAAGGADRNGD